MTAHCSMESDDGGSEEFLEPRPTKRSNSAILDFSRPISSDWVATRARRTPPIN